MNNTMLRNEGEEEYEKQYNEFLWEAEKCARLHCLLTYCYTKRLRCQVTRLNT